MHGVLVLWSCTIFPIIPWSMHNLHSNINITNLLQSNQCSAHHPKELGAHISFIRRLTKTNELDGHGGCVNTAKWSTDGSHIVSGSDDLKLMLWSVEKNYKLTSTINTEHSRNIFCAEFVNDNRSIVSGSADGEIRLHHLDGGAVEGGQLLSSMDDMILKVVPDPKNSNVFWTTYKSEAIARFDLREPKDKKKVKVVDHPKPLVNALTFNPLNTNLAILACSDPIVRLYDFRTHKVIAKYGVPEVMKNKKESRASMSIMSEINASGIAFNNKNQFAVSFCGHDVYLFDALYGSSNEICTDVVNTYTGHRNIRTFLKDVTFIGLEGEYIASGSDCGNLFIWDTKNSRVVQLLKGDTHVVNGVSAHPTHPSILCSWGIESTVKIWEATAPEPTYKPARVQSTRDIETNYILNRALMATIAERRARRQAEQTNQTTATAPNVTETTSAGSRGSAVQEYTQEEFDECLDPNWPANVLVLARLLRLEGNDSFKENDHAFAFNAYKHAIECLESATPANEEQQRLILNELLPCLLNRAAVALPRKEYAQAVVDCTKVLKHDPENVKALYRRGMAHFKRADYERSLADLQAANNLESSVATKRAIADVKQAMEEHKKKESQMFSNMFK